MRSFGIFWRLWLIFSLLICHTCGQTYSSLPSISPRSLSPLSQKTRPPDFLETNPPVKPQANHSKEINAIDTIPHALLKEPARHRTSNQSLISPNTTETERLQNGTNMVPSKRIKGQFDGNKRLPILPSPIKSLVTGNILVNNSGQARRIAPSSTTNSSSFTQSSSSSVTLPLGFIKATGGLIFGLPSKGLNNSTGGLAAQPLITPPPAPPIRPDGLNLTGVKAVKVYNAALTANTSITTISPGGTQPTVVPVLVKAAGVGVAIFGLSAAIEAGAPLLEAGEAVEAAEEEAAGEEDEEDEDENHSTYSTSRSRSLTTTSTSSSSSDSASSSSSASSTSSQSSTSSRTADACSNPTDFPHLGNADGEDNDDEYESAKIKRSRRSSAVERRQLLQMGTYVNLKKPVTKLGSCRLNQDTKMPPFWKANSLMGKSGNSAYWYMPVPEDPDNLNVAPTYTTAATAALRTLSPSRKSVIIGGSSGYRTNVDHVYEVSLLKNFFNYYLAQRSVCQTFNDEFMPNTTTENQASRLSVIFAQLPGVEFGGLAGMDQRLNSIKAYFFQAGEIQNGLGFRANGLCDSIKNLQMAGMIMDMLHSAELRSFFSETNSRIYQALLGVDNAIAADISKGCNEPPKKTFSWAEEYKGWINWFLSERESEIQYWARNTQKTILNSLNQKVMNTDQVINGKPVTVLDPSYDDDRKRMNAFMKSAYGRNSHWTFNFNLEYPTNALPMAKRDEGCVKSIPPSSTTNSAAPTTATSSPTSIDVQQAAATAATAQEVPKDGGGAVQPHKAPLPSDVVNFINNKNMPEPPAHSNSANQLNNEKSANQFNNAIQQMASPAASVHPSGSGDIPSQARGNSPAGSSPASA